MTFPFSLPSSATLDRRVYTLLAARLSFNWPLFLKAFICNLTACCLELRTVFLFSSHKVPQCMDLSVFYFYTQTSMNCLPPASDNIALTTFRPSPKPMAHFRFIFVVSLFCLYEFLHQYREACLFLIPITRLHHGLTEGFAHCCSSGTQAEVGATILNITGCHSRKTRGH